MIECEGTWYHVMNRGRRSDRIFKDGNDYRVFIDLPEDITRFWDAKQNAKKIDLILDLHWTILKRLFMEDFREPRFSTERWDFLFMVCILRSLLFLMFFGLKIPRGLSLYRFDPGPRHQHINEMG